MRAAIIAGMMAVGLLAGCGGAEDNEMGSVEETNQVVEFATPGPCTDACDAQYYQCYFSGIPQYTCSSNRAYCISRCP